MSNIQKDGDLPLIRMQHRMLEDAWSHLKHLQECLEDTQEELEIRRNISQEVMGYISVVSQENLSKLPSILENREEKRDPNYQQLWMNHYQVCQLLRAVAILNELNLNRLLFAKKKYNLKDTLVAAGQEVALFFESKRQKLVLPSCQIDDEAFFDGCAIHECLTFLLSTVSTLSQEGQTILCAIGNSSVFPSFFEISFRYVGAAWVSRPPQDTQIGLGLAACRQILQRHNSILFERPKAPFVTVGFILPIPQP